MLPSPLFQIHSILSGNQITKLSAGNFQNLFYLKELWVCISLWNGTVHYMSFSRFSHRIASLASLDAPFVVPLDDVAGSDLRDNQISSLDADVFRPLQSLEILLVYLIWQFIANVRCQWIETHLSIYLQISEQKPFNESGFRNDSEIDFTADAFAGTQPNPLHRRGCSGFAHTGAFVSFGEPTAGNCQQHVP